VNEEKEDRVVVRVEVSIASEGNLPLKTSAESVVERKFAMRELCHCARCAVECLGAVRRSLSKPEENAKPALDSVEELRNEEMSRKMEKLETLKQLESFRRDAIAAGFPPSEEKAP